MENHKKYVLMQGITDDNWLCRFYTLNTPEKDQTRGYTGEVWYQIIGYADSIEDAQMQLYGRTYSL
jgi:hypothetical protein